MTPGSLTRQGAGRLREEENASWCIISGRRTSGELATFRVASAIKRLTKRGIMLLKGIAIHCFSNKDLNSSSIELVSGAKCIGSGDAEECFIPSEGWRSIEPLEVDILRSTSLEMSDLYLLSLPEGKVRSIQEEILYAVTSPDYQETLKLPIEHFARSAVSWLNSLELPFRYSYLGADLALAPPGLASTAFDRVKCVYKGLHIDDHEKLPYERRNQAFVLFSINLGSTTRFFQFVNLEIRAILKMVAIDPLDKTVQSCPPRRLKDVFLRQYPEYPVIRATLHPGDAYLGQTQNMIHDGSTNSLGVTDISLQIALRAKLP